jgi:(-)-germacrene D synthase
VSNPSQVVERSLQRSWSDLLAGPRGVECYLWSYTAYYEEEHARARMILAKMIALIILTDDTYDVRATLEECRRFDEAIQRFALECSSSILLICARN